MTMPGLETIPDFRRESYASGRMPQRPLSPRERQIHDLVSGGRTPKEVAFELGIAAATVRVLYARAKAKLGGAKPGAPRGSE